MFGEILMCREDWKIVLTTAECFREDMWSWWASATIAVSFGYNVNFVFRARPKLRNVERTYALPAAKCVIHITHHSAKKNIYIDSREIIEICEDYERNPPKQFVLLENLSLYMLKGSALSEKKKKCVCLSGF